MIYHQSGWLAKRGIEMTNKTERFLVMSEAEFERVLLLRAALSSSPGYVALKVGEEYQQAEAACRARPVEPLDITEWPDKTIQTWVGEVKK